MVPAQPNHLRSFAAFQMLIVRPTGDDIGNTFFWQMSVHTLMLVVSGSHVDVMELLQTQFSVTPIVLFSSGGGYGRDSCQYIGLQMTNLIPEFLAVTGPRQVFEKGPGLSDVLPHCRLVQLGGGQLHELSYAPFKIDQDSIHVTKDLVGC